VKDSVNNLYKAVGTMSLESTEIYSQCKAKNEYFSHDYEINIESSKRCFNSLFVFDFKIIGFIVTTVIGIFVSLLHGGRK
jgi:hypothetical protein